MARDDDDMDLDVEGGDATAIDRSGGAGGDEDAGMEQEVGGGWRITGEESSSSDRGVSWGTAGGSRKASGSRKVTGAGSRKSAGGGRKRTASGSRKKSGGRKGAAGSARKGASSTARKTSRSGLKKASGGGKKKMRGGSKKRR